MPGFGIGSRAGNEEATRRRVCVDREMTIAGASRLMRAFGVEQLVVMDTRGGEPVPIGVMSARQIVTRIVATGLEPGVLTAGDIIWSEESGREAEALASAFKEWLRLRFGAKAGSHAAARHAPPPVDM